MSDIADKNVSEVEIFKSNRDKQGKWPFNDPSIAFSGKGHNSKGLSLIFNNTDFLSVFSKK